MSDIIRPQDVIALEAAHGSGAHAPAPVVIVRGRGSRLWDSEGRVYLDCGTGIGVAALGHAHPALARALSEQAGTLLTCANGYYHHPARSRLLSELARLTPGNLNRVFLCNSGTEAVETALKLARIVTGRGGIVAAKRAFHGRTLGALSATWKARYREPFAPLLPGVTHVPVGEESALERAVTEDTSAVLLETVQGEAGVHPLPAAFLAMARRLCDERGALLVLDEVQCGMGRTGSWFACERYGVVPDALCLAKALGGGVPIGATTFRQEISFQRGQHGSTLGGNPLACRAALAVIETIEAEGLLEHVARVGAHLREGLLDLQRAAPAQVRAVRGLGLMLALELRRRVGPVLQALLERGVLALSGGPTTLRLLPPYILTSSEADEALAALRAVLT